MVQAVSTWVQFYTFFMDVTDFLHLYIGFTVYQTSRQNKCSFFNPNHMRQMLNSMVCCFKTSVNEVIRKGFFSWTKQSESEDHTLIHSFEVLWGLDWMSAWWVSWCQIDQWWLYAALKRGPSICKKKPWKWGSCWWLCILTVPNGWHLNM